MDVSQLSYILKMCYRNKLHMYVYIYVYVWIVYKD